MTGMADAPMRIDIRLLQIPPADPTWSASSTEITVGGSQKGLPAQYRDIRADPYPLVEPVLEVLRGEQRCVYLACLRLIVRTDSSLCRASIPLEAQLYALSDLHVSSPPACPANRRN